MEQVLKELSLYDLTGYLLPGIVVVWSAVFVVNASRFRRQKERINLTTVGILVAGYITGHMLQAVATFVEQRWFSSTFWQPLSQRYASTPAFANALRVAIVKTFGAVATGREFILCQTYVQTRGLDSYTDVMQARYAFFKGLTLALLVSSALFAVEALIWLRRRTRRANNPAANLHRDITIMAVIFMVTTLLSFGRLIQFEHDYTDSVYRTFYVGLLLSDAERPRR